MKQAFLFVAIVAMALPARPYSQSNDSAVSPFAGKWTGICQDDNPFVVLNLKLSDNALVGYISIANMHGENGQCEAVIDPPTPEHAMKISSAKLEGKILSFQASSHAHFTMALDTTQKAQLRLLGTPVEDSPWQLTKSTGESR